MSVTQKELAARLNLSPTAVNMALNGKPGVSEETRRTVLSEAERLGFDFSRLKRDEDVKGDIYCIMYRSHNAILNYTPIFSEVTEGMETEVRRRGYSLKTLQFYEGGDSIDRLMWDLRLNDAAALIIVGTEITAQAAGAFAALGLPTVLLDASFDTVPVTSVTINNVQGAYAATAHLIQSTKKQPGHLKSSYTIQNFAERREGFEKAVRDHGMSLGNSPTHELAPSVDGAFQDMLAVLDAGTPVMAGYFADNDLIAIGALKALELRGYAVGEDVSIVGFDNINEGRIVQPQLTTMDVPRRYLGERAVAELFTLMETRFPHPVKIEVATTLVKRTSTPPL